MKSEMKAIVAQCGKRIEIEMINTWVGGTIAQYALKTVKPTLTFKQCIDRLSCIFYDTTKNVVAPAHNPKGSQKSLASKNL